MSLKDQKHYWNNREQRLAANKAWREANADYLRDKMSKYDRTPARRKAKQARYVERCVKVRRIKADGGCVDCPEHDPDVLDFDHRDPQEKAFEIGTYGQGRAWSKVLAEIAKCDIRCANCHRRITKCRREACI